MLKLLFLAYLYDLSERQLEVFVNDSLSAKYFLGLAADESCPGSTTFTVFKGRLLQAWGQRPEAAQLRRWLQQPTPVRDRTPTIE